MRWLPKRKSREEGPTDDALLALFLEDPHRAWDLFLDRHADSLFRHLQRLGWDYDEAMDRFTYVCEKLREHDFRRMRAIRHTGRAGELTPWLFVVAERLSVNWLWSVEGRDRLFRSIEALSAYEQRVFELHFRHGLTPGAIHEQLRVESQPSVTLADVFDALEKIFARLSPNRIWKLLSQLSRKRGTLSLDGMIRNEDGTIPFEPVDPALTPEEALIQREESEQANRVLHQLAPRDLIIVRLRYEESLGPAQIAKLLQIEEKEVRGRLQGALRTLRPGRPLSVEGTIGDQETDASFS